MPVQSSSLELAAKYLYRYGGLILVVFGNVGCFLNIMVFSRKALRKNPCSIYYIAVNIFDFLFINSLLLFTTLETGFDIYITTKNIVVCRLCYYTSLYSNVLSSFCLISASIDRVLVTSSNVLTRQRSTVRLTYLCIISGTIFWMLFHSPALAFTNILQFEENVDTCFYQPGFYLTFISYYSIVKESSSILLLLIFGVWTIKNIQRLHRIKISITGTSSGTVRVGRSHIVRSKDRQLVFIVLKDIIFYAIFCSTAAIFLTEQQITQYQNKTVEQAKFDIFLKQVTIFCLHIPFTTGCYTNLFVSKAYRNTIKHIFSWNRIFPCH
ncbi:unnamed protein product [Rotaria sordida]|uniref:G-protein coupled receptors family 1 profile domain-containing protein n=1 Tax=Rotaria sordida TaxID=392033 RepID=A0A814GXH3_9BILA|nr:unnamed protein product [Rotaria sordida]